MKSTDTIAAISTSIGEGGIGIVRLSGKSAIQIIKKIFHPAKKNIFSPHTHTITYGVIFNSDTKETIDDVLVSVMLAPKSYTREDVVEINCHGGIIPLNEILKLVISCGARLAEPGEFTKRAFLNGRIDLVQAEAVIDIIRAKTNASMRQARFQLEGKISGEIDALRNILIELLSNLELSIDFIEDNIEIIPVGELEKNINKALEKIEKLLSTTDIGRLIKEGIRVAIIGRPNVGKSSLLNALLNEERAIVTHLPGTTRDVIEEMLSIKGIPAKIIDTAGIRKTTDEIEKIGIERTRKSIVQADIVLFVFDISENLHEEDIEIIKEIKNKKTIFVFNKIDKNHKLEINKLPQNIQQVRISAANNNGIEELKTHIYDLIIKEHIEIGTEVFINNLRHEIALKNAKSCLNRAIEGIKNKLSSEFIVSDIREATVHLGSIIGKTTTDDVLNQIFEKFCIGK
ncbi:tRNA uridine-5-carboxymethylaminomethyl(34) synthesis GTPase MnmE [Candidatus Poribacteria bacterium]|nr:tRNA uridine-5-carboxymethylaminomethyl(34) synthesis GTPase MnmE [Candidatus Poribacteria bacterium]